MSKKQRLSSHFKILFLIGLLNLLFLTTQAQVSNQGREFWLGFMEISGNPSSGNPIQNQRLAISSQVNTRATIRIPKQNWSQTVNITANQITIVTLPPSAHTIGSESVQPNAIQVTSSDLITLFASHESDARSEASVVLPIDVLGVTTEYYIASYQGVLRAPNNQGQIPTPRFNHNSHSEFLIVALRNDTEVTIVPTAPTRNEKPANVPFKVTLNAGDVYQVQSQPPTAYNFTLEDRAHDLTGTRIFSDGNCKPFAVFSGSNATITNSNCMAWEHIYEQQFPTKTWGKNYYVTPFAQAAAGYLVRVIAAEDNTSVTVRPNSGANSTFTLNKGEYRTLEVTQESAMCISATLPIAVAQYMKGQNCNGVPTSTPYPFNIPQNQRNPNRGDPAMIMLNPIDQTVRQAAFSTISTNNLNFETDLYFINVIMRTADLNRLKLKSNGIDMSLAAEVAAAQRFTGCAGYSYLTIKIPIGTHYLEADRDFIAYHYAYGAAEGYAYSVGATFENLDRNFTMSDNLICVGDRVDFAGFGVDVLSYSWNFGDGGTATGQNASHTFNRAGTFTVKMRVTFSGDCGVDEIPKTITVLPYPIVNLGSTRTICRRDTIELDAGVQPNSPTFSWSGGETTQKIKVFREGIYKVKVKNRAGCIDSSQVEVKFFPETPVNINSNLKNSYCIDNQIVILAGTPAGGTFTINGNGATQFNPRALGEGNHQVIYSFRDGNACTNRDTLLVTVHPLPTPSITNLNPAYCVDVPAFDLTATPSGGTFTIRGQTVTKFDPALLKVGDHEVIYTYQDGNACINTDKKTVRVNPLPVLSFVNLINAYCVDNEDIILEASPSGGTFKVNGQNALVFSPKTLQVGEHQVVYTYQDANGCVNSISKTVKVNPLPTPQITTNLRPVYCTNEAPITLVATPSGGRFSINGNVVTRLEANRLGVGEFKIIYTYRDANTCVSYDTVTVQIEAPPVVSIINLPTNFCKDAAPFDILASPENGNGGVGVFTIDNNPTPVTQIRAPLLSSGNHTLTYTFTDSRTNCVSAITRNFSISSLPSVSLVSVDGLKDKYCYNQTPFALAGFGVPAGGDFYLNGIKKTTFNPQDPDLGLSADNQGIIQVVYLYKDQNNCLNLDSKNITILPLPETKITNLKADYCVQNAAFKMQAIPLGGRFSINGQNSDGTFNPGVLGVGEHTVIYTERTGCVSFVKKVNVRPPLPVLSSQGLKVCSFSGTPTILDAGEGASYRWSNRQTTRTIAIEQSGTYEVEVTDSLGCKTMSKLTVIEKCEPKFIIPNAFSPNGDGLNDVLEIFAQDITDFSLTVYNRWGEIIFIAPNRKVFWDGTQNGKAIPDGTYVCVIKYQELPERIERSFTGKVRIIR
ncbi:MAG: gliding motility-associated C-terminal domain-containing protein [Microscillaceae bacterium]|jgi:gliding motility-associated-like protein|nr:gliding motility-associated C-terminal domain-containing protein [Microscillaceae bacterium]